MQKTPLAARIVNGFTAVVRSLGKLARSGTTLATSTTACLAAWAVVADRPEVAALLKLLQ